MSAKRKAYRSWHGKSAWLMQLSEFVEYGTIFMIAQPLFFKNTNSLQGARCAQALCTTCSQLLSKLGKEVRYSIWR
jgi:hypothetical protein